MTAPTQTAAPEAPVKVRRVIVAASIGNALEWFDILVYGFFAATISNQFFPTADETVSLLLTLGTFAVAYVVRPLGALVLGAYADRAGRKRALMVSIRLMMVATLLIAVMPPYAKIGLVAPIAILIARLIQGFSAGGEFGSATAFLVEHMPEKRGFMASWQFASQGLATLLASAFGTVLTATLSDAQLESWGWRIPFFFGLLIGPVGYYIRRYVGEAGEFVKTADQERAPVKETFRTQKDRMLVAMGALAVSTAISYFITYMPTFAVKELDLPASTGFASTLVTGIVLTGLTPVVGHLSDRFGRTRIMLIFATLILALVYPSLAFLVAAPGFGVILGVMFLVGVLKAGYFAPLPAMMAELFPVTNRATGLAVSYNIAVMLFGGTTPLIIVWLVDVTGNKLAPTFYLMFLAVLSLSCVAFARRRLDIH
ncbi:major facilitator family transporter [Streptomyces himastatinicus ATCC 53653]|uniref:Putative proline/betaine transporter n=1 Tax=Streptomyces himastatinicus ATCC 53653 TaxID=457427 RepID=D9WKW1_9ACTN|nr:MFS transporter [Streptomyces himastatinicus]EFL27801.1 major facilitator family transporter [Streptomyces himastatinicus ATCC 53653]